MRKFKKKACDDDNNILHYLWVGTFVTRYSPSKNKWFIGEIMIFILMILLKKNGLLLNIMKIKKNHGFLYILWIFIPF